MKRTSLVILPLILSLALATLACAVSLGGPSYPDTPIPVSTEDVGIVEKQFEDAATAAANSGTLTLNITESQLTALVAAKLSQQEEPIITEPQVYLRDGQIQIYGKAVRGNFQANVRIVLTASVNENGKPAISVVSVDFGPLPAPDSINNTISKMVDEAFSGAIGPAATGFRLESITIQNGTMTLTGRVK